MITGTTPYTSMKPSGIPWLGDIPAHWTLSRTKALLAERSDKGHPDKPLLAATQTKGVVRKENYANRTVLALKDLHLLKFVEVGDFVISLRSFQGGIEYARDSGIISPAYTVLYPKDPRHHRFFAFLFKSRCFVDSLVLAVTGIREGQNIDYGRLARSTLPLPPLSEQAAIARFLDHMDRRIQKFIRAKEKLIALLDEYKQVLIHQAVTNGLDSEPTVVSTGNSWFPKIPVDWKVLPMRRVIHSAIDGPHHSPNYVDQGIPFLSARNIKANCWSLGDVKYISQNDYETFCQRIKPELGDVLYTKGGTTGIARVVDLDYPFQVWVHVAVLKVRTDLVVPEYLALALNSKRCYEQSQLLTRGATNQDLGLGRMKDIVLTVPPLSVQREIVAHVNFVGESISSGSHGVARLIQLLKECRTRLTSDVVTGKLDVREAAAELPDTNAAAWEAGVDTIQSASHSHGAEHRIAEGANP